MSGPGSLKRLLLQVVLLSAVLVGLSRLAGRAGGPAVDDRSAAPAAPAAPASPRVDEMSSAPPDLSFYRTLGDGRPAGGAGGPAGAHKDDALAGPPEASAAPGGAFLVQALATREALAARRLRDRLAARGFPATVSEDRSGGTAVYRVRVGRYRTRPEAEAAARVLRDRLRLSPWVLQEGE